MPEQLPPESQQVIKTESVTTGPQVENSTILGVSIRGWIAVWLIATVCCNQLFVTIAVSVYAIMTLDFSLVGPQSTIGEPLYSLSIGALGYYFGQSNKNKTNT